MDLEGRKVLLCEPVTFMNASGEAVRSVADYFKIDRSRWLIVLDDADLPFGAQRMRPTGGTGGHHGLESIEQIMSTADYARLRIGIGRADGRREITGHVLGEFDVSERAALDEVLDRVAGQIECWVTAGIQRAMNEFNGGADAAGAKETE